MITGMGSKKQYFAALYAILFTAAVILAALLFLPGRTGRQTGAEAAPVIGEDKKLILYTSHKPEVYGPIVREFEARTGIWVQVRSGGTTELLEELKKEAGRGDCDVMFGGGVESYDAYRDCFQPYECDKSNLLDQTYRASDGRWTPFTELPIVFIYNNKLVDESQAPKGWRDLLSDRFKGEIAFADPQRSGTSYTALATMLQALPVDERPLMERFTEVLDGKVSPGSGEVVDEVSNGARLVGVTLEETAKKKIKQGADLCVVYPAEGTSAVPDGSAIVKGAPHPENARRFIDFTVSDDVQRLVADQFMRRTIRTDIGQEQTAKGFKIIDFDLARAGREQAQLLTLWSELMKQKGS